MRRLKQTNEMLRAELAAIISREINFKDILVTLMSIDCSPDFKNAKVYLSVLPPGLSGNVLKILKKHGGLLARQLQKRAKLRETPRLLWTFDETEKNAAEIEEILKQIKNE